jgi:uncharacterized repeat protein (TIGR03803 family)
VSGNHSRAVRSTSPLRVAVRLISDNLGNYYGATWIGGINGGGTVYQLSPSNGGWTLTVIYSLTGGGFGPYGNLARDAAGNLYGITNAEGAYGFGSIFKLTPSGGGWIYNSLHDFTGGSDGGYPYGNITFGQNGNFYGTASIGGAHNYGVIWEITVELEERSPNR